MNLDGVGQRQFVLALSFVVQGIKLYDWLSYQQCPTAFLLKWAFWETSLLIVLWKIKVPRLAFSFPVSLAFAFLLATFNVLLFFGIPYGVRQVRYRLIPLSTAVEMVGIESNSVDEIIGSKEHLIEGSVCQLWTI